MHVLKGTSTFTKGYFLASFLQTNSAYRLWKFFHGFLGDHQLYCRNNNITLLVLIFIHIELNQLIISIIINKQFLSLCTSSWQLHQLLFALTFSHYLFLHKLINYLCVPSSHSTTLPLLLNLEKLHCLFFPTLLRYVWDGGNKILRSLFR